MFPLLLLITQVAALNGVKVSNMQHRAHAFFVCIPPQFSETRAAAAIGAAGGGAQQHQGGQHGAVTLLCLNAMLLRFPFFTQVVALNGVKVSNMQHLVSLVDGCSEDYLHFDLDYNQKVG
jgi:hypothetical protein